MFDFTNKIKFDQTNKLLDDKMKNTLSLIKV